MKSTEIPAWWLFRGDQRTDGAPSFQLPAPPPWRSFDKDGRKRRGRVYRAGSQEKWMVNAALYLRRPLLVTGRPGTGKSSLAFAVAEELGLGDVLQWPITTRTTLKDGLYHYDAIGRLQDASLAQALPRPEDAATPRAPTERFGDIGRFLRLGPLGTALLPENRSRPRVLLIDELDKCDVDLPNDLLHLFEEGEFEIPELRRLPNEQQYQTVKVLLHDTDDRAPVERGKVRAAAFPFVVMTSNQEREFSPAFMRRCLHLELQPPTIDELVEIVRRHFELADETARKGRVGKLIEQFVNKRDDGALLATDQLLNAVHMLLADLDVEDSELRERLFHPLGYA